MSAEQKVPLEEAREQVRRVTRRLALLHLAYAKTAIEELGEEKGRRMALKAIKNYARIVGEEVKKKVRAEGKENVPANYKEDLPLYGMHDRMEKVGTDDENRHKMYGCVMAKVWHELGEDEIGRLYCYVDAAKYMYYNDKFKMAHAKAAPDGCEYCEFVLRPTTEKERRDLKADVDWRYIDSVE